MLLVFCMSLTCCAQTTPVNFPVISTESMQQDFAVFRDSLEKLHAGLYRYRDKAEITRSFDSAYLLLNQPMTVPQFFLVLKFLVANIQDGHTSCNLPSELMNALTANNKMFPVHLRFIGEKAFISCNTKPGFPDAGSEIIAIDKLPVAKIKKTLFSYLASDGDNQTKKYWDLSSDAFIPLYFLVFGAKSSFTIETKTGDGKLKPMTLNGDSLKNAQCRPAVAKNVKYLDLDFKPNKIAILTVKTFSSGSLKSPEEFSKFLETSFKEISDREINKLIIDIRDNGGGNDVYGSMLYSYLTDKPFHYYTSLESTSRKFEKEEHPNLSIQQPSKNNFRGKAYFLINGKSFSTTAEFCSIAKSNERGVFIGEETGGGYYGNTSGARARIVLPNSKITLGIPKTKYTMAVKKSVYSDRGIIPDFTIIPGIQDIIRNRDIQLHYALKLAGGR